MAAATRQPAPVNVDLGGAPWWVWTGGAFGATFILVVILLTARIGATLTLASGIAGQLMARWSSITMDCLVARSSVSRRCG